MNVGIVVPCFNEERRWSDDYWASMFALEGVTWLLYDDGSADGTGRLLDAAAQRDNVSVVHASRNAGKAEGVRQGLLRLMEQEPALAAVGYMDADGAFNPQDVSDMLRVYRGRVLGGGCEAVWSSRVALAGRNIRRSTSRHYIGRVVATLVSMGQSEIPYDTQSGLKFFAPTPALAACLAVPFETRWLFEIELLARWHGNTGAPMRIWEEPLNYWHDVPGSKIHGRESMRILRELAVVKRAQRRGTGF